MTDRAGESHTSSLGVDERRFYVVMHHLATALWVKGLSVEALGALTAVLEWANDGRHGAASTSPNARSVDQPRPAGQSPLDAELRDAAGRGVC